MTEEANPFTGLEPIADTPIAPGHALGAVALNLALKYHAVSTVQDGTLYQALKLEGRNLPPISFEDVLKTAERIELHLLSTPNRLAAIVLEGLAERVVEAILEDEPEAPDGQA